VSCKWEDCFEEGGWAHYMYVHVYMYIFYIYLYSGDGGDFGFGTWEDCFEEGGGLMEVVLEASFSKVMYVVSFI
jgi:hypothetical protein